VCGLVSRVSRRKNKSLSKFFNSYANCRYDVNVRHFLRNSDDKNRNRRNIHAFAFFTIFPSQQFVTGRIQICRYNFATLNHELFLIVFVRATKVYNIKETIGSWRLLIRCNRNRCRSRAVRLGDAGRSCTHVKYDARHGRELLDVNVRQNVHQVTLPAGGETQSAGGEQRAVGRPESGYRDRQRYHPGDGSQRPEPERL